jgi:SnoaL-like domain
LEYQEGDLIMTRTNIDPGNALTGISAPDRILQSAMAALSEGQISEVVDRFDDSFKFTDHALGLEFTDKRRLIEFLQKSRELYPDTVAEVVSIFEYGDHAVAEWKLTATETVPCGSKGYRFPILLRGATIARTRNGRVTRWSDYYDQTTSRRFSLAAFFTEWIED